MADEKKRGAFSTALEAYSAYNNPAMWAADKIIPKIPVVGPLYEKGKALPETIVRKWLEQPPPGWKPAPQLGKKNRGKWPRKNLRQPVRKNQARPIQKMGPFGGAMPLAPSSSTFIDAVRRLSEQQQGRPRAQGGLAGLFGGTKPTGGNQKRGGLLGLFGGQTGPNVLNSWRQGQRTAANTAGAAVGGLFGKADRRSQAQQIAARLKNNWINPSWMGLIGRGP